MLVCSSSVKKKLLLLLKVNLRACLYHGRDNLCSSINSPECRDINGSVMKWEEQMSFDLKLCNIPRMMRLCFLLYATGEQRKRQTGRAGRLPTGGKTVKADGRRVSKHHLHH